MRKIGMDHNNHHQLEEDTVVVRQSEVQHCAKMG